MFTSDRNLYITTIGNNNNYMPHAHTSREIVAHRRNSERGRSGLRVVSQSRIFQIKMMLRQDFDATLKFLCVILSTFSVAASSPDPLRYTPLTVEIPSKTNFSCASYYISVFDATSLPSDKKDFPFSAGQMEKIMFHRLFDCMKVSGIVYRTYIRHFPLIAVSL